MKTQKLQYRSQGRTIQLAVILTLVVASGHGQLYDFSTIAGGVGSEAPFCLPCGTTVDRSGNVYVADACNHTIRKLTPLGASWLGTTIAGSPGESGSADGTNSAALFNNPRHLTIDPSGVLYVVDSYNNTVRRLTPVGANWVVTTIAGLAGVGGFADGTNDSARFKWPIGIAMGKDGALYVSDPGNSAIRKLSPVDTNWVVTTIAKFGEWIKGTNGSLYVSTPFGLAADQAGNIFIANTGFSIIQKLSTVGPNLAVTTIAGQGGQPGSADGIGTAARFSGPDSVAVDETGNLFVADAGNCTIRKLTPTGDNWAVTTVGGQAGNYGYVDGVGSASRFHSPWSVAVSTEGSLFVSDAGNNVIRFGQPIPTLQVARSAQGVLLSWPASAGGLLLETSSALDPGAAWVPLNGAAPGSLLLTNAPSGRAGFFRLRRP